MVKLAMNLSLGEFGIIDWYQHRFDSRSSRICWQSGYTKSAHVSHSGCTIYSINPT